MKRCNLPGPTFEHLLPAAQSLQNNRAEIDRGLRWNNGFSRRKRLDARNGPDKEVLLLLGKLVGPCQSLKQKFHHRCKTEPYEDVPFGWNPTEPCRTKVGDDKRLAQCLVSASFRFARP